MSDEDLSSNTTEHDDSSNRDGDGGDGHTPRLGDRFRAPSSSDLDIPQYAPEDGDEAVDKVAKRFRSTPRLGSAESAPASLDEQGGGDEDVDEGSVLEALDGPSEPDNSGASPGVGGPPLGGTTEAGVDEAVDADASDPVGPDSSAADDALPMVDIEPIADDNNGDSDGGDGPDGGDEGRPVVCPSCHAENPEGMRFCVECGGSLEGGQASKGASQLQGEAASGRVEPVDVDREPPPPSDAAQKQSPWDIQMVSINEDGTDGKSIPLNFLETTVGRDGDDRFPTDAFLSPRHARFHIDDGQLFIEDLYSLNGTFIKLRDETRLTPGDTILMGRQVLRFERFDQSITPKTKSSDGTRYMGSPAPGGNFKVLQVGIGGVVQNVYCLPEAGAVLGREKGDIVFPHDKFMSGRHAQIYPGDDGHSYLVDLNSSNGTWTKIWEKTALDDGDYIFMGQQLFRVQYD